GVGIGLDAFAHGAAEQDIDRQMSGLTDDVPAGDFDQADGGSANLPHTTVIVAEHALDDVFDQKMIGSQDVALLVLLQIAEQSIGWVGEVGLAKADQALSESNLTEGQE